MVIRRSAGARSSHHLLALVIPLAASAVGAAPGPAENPFAEQAAVEQGRLQELGDRPEAVAPLLALFALRDVLPPGYLDRTVEELVGVKPAPAGGGGGVVVEGRTGEGGKVSVDPLVAARARDWLARRLEEKGDDQGAATVRGPLGVLTRLWVVGPFGDGRASIDVPFPPESEHDGPDSLRSYPGKERKVGWRRATGAMRRGALDLGALLRPDSQAAAYALAFVRVDGPTHAALRLGSPGPTKVWCNGQLVHAADRVRSARFDQDAVPVDLRPGWNRLLVKTVVTQGSWRVYARLTLPDGAPLAFDSDWDITAAAAAATGPGAATSARRARRRSADPAFAVRALEPILRERVRGARSPAAAAQASLDLGRYLLTVDSTDRDQKEAALAFEASVARRPTVDALMGLSSAGRDEDESRRALERALAIARSPRERAAVLSALGDVSRDQHRESVAIQRWREALAADSRWWPASLSLAGEEQAAGFPSAAWSRIEALPPGIRALPLVARERARILTDLDRRVEGESVRRQLLLEARDDADLLRELASAARSRGDGAASKQYLERAAALRPDLPSLTIEWARALEGAGEREGARGALETAARRLPDEPLLAAELGKLLDRMGQGKSATAWLETALELRPQDPELRRYAESLATRLSVGRGGGADGSSSAGGATNASNAGGARDRRLAGDSARPPGHTDLARRFGADVPSLLLAEAARRPRGIGPRGQGGPPADLHTASGPDPATVVLDRRVVRVHPNGLSEVFAQRVVEIQTDSGAEDNKEFFVRYTPGSEEVEILEARIFRRAGAGPLEVLQASDRDDQDLSEPWYGLYYDYRAEIVRFEGLRAGDVLEVQYVVSDVSRENQLAGYFGDLQFLAETIPKRQWDYVLLAPPGRDFQFARPILPGLEATSSDEGGEHVTRFVARDIPRIEVEPAMPGIAEVSPYLHVSTYKSWEDVGRWYWRLIEEQLVADDSVRRAADGALQAAAAGTRRRRGHTASDLRDDVRNDVRNKVRALHDLVLGGTRYVGLEFGIHGFKPYKVSQVLARKFGDCKDKAALLTALLTYAHVDAEMVLLRTRRGGRIAPAPASLAVFDHAIVYVPKLDLYLDGTAEFSGMKELPSQDQGAMVLRVGPRGSKLLETPVLPSERNRATRSWVVRLKADGDGEVDERLTIEGQAAPDWRSHYQTPGERMDRYAKVWTGRHPGARLETVEMPGIEDRNQPVAVNATATVPRIAERTSEGALLLTMGARDADLVRTYARLSSRRSELVLAYPWQHQDTVRYQLPAGQVATSLPRSRTIQTKFGSFQLHVDSAVPGSVVVVARLDVAQDRVSAADYPAFRRFLADVDAVMAERIVVDSAPPRAAAAGPFPPGEPPRWGAARVTTR